MVRTKKILYFGYREGFTKVKRNYILDLILQLELVVVCSFSDFYHMRSAAFLVASSTLPDQIRIVLWNGFQNSDLILNMCTRENRDYYPGPQPANLGKIINVDWYFARWRVYDPEVPEQSEPILVVIAFHRINMMS